jgi:hypothetical protein
MTPPKIAPTIEEAMRRADNEIPCFEMRDRVRIHVQELRAEFEEKGLSSRPTKTEYFRKLKAETQKALEMYKELPDDAAICDQYVAFKMLPSRERFLALKYMDGYGHVNKDLEILLLGMDQHHRFRAPHKEFEGQERCASRRGLACDCRCDGNCPTTTRDVLEDHLIAIMELNQF